MCKKGEQSRRVYCVSNIGQRAADKMCADTDVPMPIIVRACISDTCPYQWVPGPWSTVCVCVYPTLHSSYFLVFENVWQWSSLSTYRLSIAKGNERHLIIARCTTDSTSTYVYGIDASASQQTMCDESMRCRLSMVDWTVECCE